MAAAAHANGCLSTAYAISVSYIAIVIAFTSELRGRSPSNRRTPRLKRISRLTKFRTVKGYVIPLRGFLDTDLAREAGSFRM